MPGRRLALLSAHFISPTDSAPSRQLRRVRRIVLARIPIVLVRCIHQRTLVLLSPSRRIVRQPTLQPLTPYTRRALHARGRLTQRIVAFGEVARGLCAGADIDGCGVGGVEVGGCWGLVRKREVALAFVDDLGFALAAGAVDDGLGKD